MLNKIVHARLERQIIKSMRDFLEGNLFFEIFPPKLVKASGACENINTLFEVGVDNNLYWFNPKDPHKAYLSQTAQLYLEAFVPYLKKVFTIGPSFRAESGNDDRHLIEFTMLEIEFAGNFKQLLRYIERIVFKVLSDIINLSTKEKKALDIDKKNIERLKKIKLPFPRITYDEAIKILKLSFGSDILRQNEEILIQKFDNQPIFITHFPNPLFDHGKNLEVEKFFNMIPDPENPARVLSSDLILPFGGESVGSAQRIHKIGELKWRLENSKMFKRLKERGGSLKDFEWYINRVAEKSVPHAGGGFGIGRVLKFIKGEKDIRNILTFPSNQENLI